MYRGGYAINRGYLRYSSGPLRFQYVHRIVVERLLGRKLKRSEEVHHMDFDRLHNCPCNLLLLPRCFHGIMHVHAKQRDEGGRFLTVASTLQEPDWVTGGLDRRGPGREPGDDDEDEEREGTRAAG
jgi:hypothetical protein